jgi:hypothetical protein
MAHCLDTKRTYVAGTGQERVVKDMKDVSTKTAHEQPGTLKEPVLPPRLDIRQADNQEGEVDYAAKISLRKQIPNNGPERPRMRVRIAYVVLFVWVGWGFFGAIRLALTGDSTMLVVASALMLVPLSIVLKYYFRDEQPGPMKKAKRSKRSFYGQELRDSK